MVRSTSYVILGVFFVAFAAVATPAKPVRAQFLPPYSTTPSRHEVVVEIAGSRFAIPSAYIWYRPARVGGQMNGVPMQALYPDLDPYSEANKAEFERLGTGRKVGILVHRNIGRNAGAAQLEARKPHIDFTSGVEFDYGLKMYQYTSFNRSEAYITTDPSEGIYLITCWKDDLFPYPSCNTAIYYNESIYIKYTFSKDYLKDWREIGRKVKALVRSFAQNASQPDQ